MSNNVSNNNVSAFPQASTFLQISTFLLIPLNWYFYGSDCRLDLRANTVQCSFELCNYIDPNYLPVHYKVYKKQGMEVKFNSLHIPRLICPRLVFLYLNHS